MLSLEEYEAAAAGPRDAAGHHAAPGHRPACARTSSSRTTGGNSTSRTSCSRPSAWSSPSPAWRRTCGSSTGSSWSTSTRTSRPCSTTCCGPGWVVVTTSASSATPARPSTRSPAPRATTCSGSGRSSRAGRWCASSGTTAPPARSCHAANTLMRGQPGALDLVAQHAGSRARNRSCWPAPTTATRRRPSPAASPSSSAPERRTGNAPCSSASVPSPRRSSRALGRTGIPYRVQGGTRFFDRPEVKLAVHHMRGEAVRQTDDELTRRVRLRAAGQRLDADAAGGHRRSARAVGSAASDHGPGRGRPRRHDDAAVHPGPRRPRGDPPRARGRRRHARDAALVEGPGVAARGHGRRRRGPPADLARDGRHRGGRGTTPVLRRADPSPPIGDDHVVATGFHAWGSPGCESVPGSARHAHRGWGRHRSHG